MKPGCHPTRFGRGLARMLAMALMGLWWAVAVADAFDDIRQRGELIVGVKKDVPLWGQADPRTGQLTGLEPDLAALLAQRLGVRLRLVGLLSAERQQSLEQRQVDLLIATLSDTPQRRQVMTLVTPHYYGSGVNILARKTSRFEHWRDLRDRRVCGRRGAFYNRSITVSHGIDVVALYSNELALEALRDGRCDALLYDDTNIVAMLQDPAWSREYTMPLETLMFAPWAIALHRQEEGGKLASLVSQQVVEWHRAGTLLELERRWGIPNSAFVKRMHEAWGRRAGDGFHCGTQLSARTPRDCL